MGVDAQHRQLVMGGAPARLLVNVDVPDLAAGEAFYTAALGLTTGRRFGDAAVELLGMEAPLYLLRRDAGAAPAPTLTGTVDYARHWTPVHLDVAVDDLDAALARATAAGASVEGGVRETGFGRIATLADPFGHGLCLIAFTEEGCDAIVA